MWGPESTPKRLPYHKDTAGYCPIDLPTIYGKVAFGSGCRRIRVVYGYSPNEAKVDLQFMLNE
jgi:hypothetical protein